MQLIARGHGHDHANARAIARGRAPAHDPVRAVWPAPPLPVAVRGTPAKWPRLDGAPPWLVGEAPPGSIRVLCVPVAIASQNPSRPAQAPPDPGAPDCRQPRSNPARVHTASEASEPSPVRP